MCCIRPLVNVSHLATRERLSSVTWHFQGRSCRNGSAYFLSLFYGIRQNVELENISLFNYASPT